MSLKHDLEIAQATVMRAPGPEAAFKFRTVTSVLSDITRHGLDNDGAETSLRRAILQRRHAAHGYQWRGGLMSAEINMAEADYLETFLPSSKELTHG